MSDRRVLVYGPLKHLPLEFFARGVEACGDRVAYRNHSTYRPGEVEKCHFAVVFGVKYPCDKIIQDYRDRGVQTVVLDMGYVYRGGIVAARTDPAGVYWSAGFGGLNGHANFCNRLMPGDRWEKLRNPLHPWRESGSHILLCGQKPSDAAVGDMNPRQWAERALARLKELTSRPVVYRPHPEDPSPRGVKGAEYSRGKPIEEDLKDCWAAVAYNSNSLVDTVIAGIPVFALGEGSMVTAVANKDLDRIEQPEMPDRQQWTHDLAYCQWNGPELEEGLAWRHLVLGETKSVSEPAVECPPDQPGAGLEREQTDGSGPFYGRRRKGR